MSRTAHIASRCAEQWRNAAYVPCPQNVGSIPSSYLALIKQPVTSAIPMTIRGGLGGDTIHAGAGADTNYGGEQLDSEHTGQAAARVDQQFRFFAAANEWQNYLGLNEKWFYGAGSQWYYLRPNGGDASGENSIKIDADSGAGFVTDQTAVTGTVNITSSNITNTDSDPGESGCGGQRRFENQGDGRAGLRGDIRKKQKRPGRSG